MEQNKNIIPADATVDGPAGALGKTTIPSDATVGEPVSSTKGKAIIPQDATIGVHDSPVQRQEQGGFLHALKQAFFLEPQDPGAINWHNPMPGDITPEALQSIAPKGINAGAEKGLTETLSGTSQLLGKAKRFVTGESDQTKEDLITGEHHPTGIFGEAPATPEETEANGTAEQIGKTAESIIEWMAGEAAFKALTKAQKIAKALELAKGPAATLVEKYPTLAKFLFKPAAKVAGASVKGAAIGGTIEGVKSGGDVDKTLAGAGSGAVFGGGSELTSELGGAVLKKGTKLFKKVADKTLEKPLNELSTARGPALENAVQREQQLAKQLMEEPKQNVTSKSPAVPFDDEYKAVFNEQGPPKLKPEYEEYFKEHGVHHPDVVAAIDNITQEYTQAIKSADSKQASASMKAVKKAMVGLGVDLVAEKVMDDLDWSPTNKWLMRAAIAGTTLHFAKADIANALLKNPKLLVGVAQGTNKVEDVLGAMGTALRNQKVKNAVAGSLYSVNRSDSQGER